MKVRRKKLKLCKWCGVTKSILEFYTHNRMKDGRLNKCSECVRTYVKSRYRVDNRKEYEKKRNADPKRKLNMIKYSKLARSKNPQKFKARSAVNNAIRDGRLTRSPCEVCGATKSQGHHDDYSKPLEVKWLCKLHHDMRHGTSVISDGKDT